jgi:hypothetical protein
MNDRKYRHRGYQDSSYVVGPRGRRREGRTVGAPRGRGADVDRAFVFACKSCGEKRRDFEELRFDSTCGCGADLHACSQCAHFDTSARFECAQPIAARILSKKKRNECPLFAPARSFDLTGSKATPTPDDARAAFDRLFRK